LLTLGNDRNSKMKRQMGPISAKEGQRKWWCLFKVYRVFSKIGKIGKKSREFLNEACW